MACRVVSSPSSVHTFSIGLDVNSVDIQCARTVAEYPGTTHHELIVSAEEMLEAIPQVVELFGPRMLPIRAVPPCCTVSIHTTKHKL